MRPAFLNRPDAWLRTPRTGQSPIGTACAVTAYVKQKRDSLVDYVMLVLFVATLVFIGLGAL